ncbi:MAG: hypothetical protein P4L73_07365 [Caulobacteraceae bacterium]|nr:hypothetical protein [Caulobacteraceae bacterium]
MTSGVVLSPAQTKLLRRLARRPDHCRSYDAVPARALLAKGLVRIDPGAAGGPLYEITPAGRKYIALGGRTGD